MLVRRIRHHYGSLLTTEERPIFLLKKLLAITSSAVALNFIHCRHSDYDRMFLHRNRLGHSLSLIPHIIFTFIVSTIPSTR